MRSNGGPGSRRLAVAFYRSALWAMPRDVRRAHGPEMVHAFEQLLDDRGDASSAARVGFVVRAWIEVGVEGGRERGRRMGARARRAFGEEAGPRGGGGAMLGEFVTDLRHAVRGLLRTPVAAITLVSTLALGIGANTAVFSVLHGVLLAPLPYDHPEELLTIGHELTRVEGAGVVGISGPDLLDYIDGTPSLEGIGSVFTLETNLTDDRGAARVTIGWVTPDFFPVLRTTALVGRMLDVDDWTPRTRAQMEDPTFSPPPMPVMISHELWTGRFGGDPAVVGRDLVINGTAMNVVGVLPAGFRVYLPPSEGVPSRIDAFGYLPIPLTEGQRGGVGGLALARLARGATHAQAVAELEAVNARLHETWPSHERFGTRIVSAPLVDGVVGPSRALLWILFGAIGLVLLVAVANVANLLLVRALARRREFAVHAALGVGRGRVVRKVLTESLVVAGLGAAAGLVLAAWGVDVLVALAPVDIPRLDTVEIELPVFLFTLGVGVGAALLFGMAPALASSRVDGRSLVSARGDVGPGRRGLRLRNGLIVVELALSVVLVAGAGLLFRSFDRLAEVDPGYEPEGAVAVEMALPFFTYRDLDARQAFFGELRRRAGEIPGVRVAGVSPGLPLSGGSDTWLAPYALPGDDIGAENANRARYRAASVDYFAALGARVTEGREFQALDVTDAGRPGSEVAVVVDRAFADRTWPEGSAVGRTLEVSVAAYIGQGRQSTGRVVGVVEPIRHLSLALADEPTIWVPFDEYAPLEGVLVLRGEADPGVVAESVRGILRELDPGVPVFGVRPLTADVTRATAENRYALLLVGLFAATAVLLAAVGLYGVISTSVQQRTREIGVRLALGAESARIGRMVLGQGARLAVVGVGLGVGVALLAMPILESLLFEVDPGDPPTLAATALALVGVALFAGWLPAMRASRLDPLDALRTD